MADCNGCSASGLPCLTDGDCDVGESCVISGDTCTREIAAFSVGTAACNVGDVPLVWCDQPSSDCAVNEHPVIAQNMYRLKDNRFEQIGLSWLKHGFAAVDGLGCGVACQPAQPAPNLDLLGVGCWDVYGPDLNASQVLLGARSEVNSHTGAFPYPYQLAWQQTGDDIFKRLQVNTDDLKAELNPGAQYFVEGLYITPDDAADGNGNSNASYRPVDMVGPNNLNRYLAFIQDTTMDEQQAIRAWKSFNTAVLETDVQIPGEGLFVLAADAVALGNGFYRYEYALYNMNSDRSAGSFFVPLPLGAVTENVGFHDVDYHSGEVYDGADWSASITGPGITWETVPYSTDINANALRWGTLYNFRFDANVAPDVAGAVTIGLFKPGTPTSISAATVAPLLAVIDCNDNGIPDSDDIFAGTSTDCDSNAVPDECQADCNANGVADTCDLTDGTSFDCNTNSIPDECDTDCDANGTPDDCEAFADCNMNGMPDACDPDCNLNGVPDDCEGNPDTDEDGIPDCLDACRLTSPPDACVCGPDTCCFFDIAPGVCFTGFTPQQCVDTGGTPDCFPSALCRDGCLVGDWNEDAVVDFGDAGGVQQCFSGSVAAGGFVLPSEACRRFFDFDSDTDVDLDDYLAWFTLAFGGG